MCGRYALFRWNRDFAALPGFPADQQAQWNISPNDSVLMLRAEADGQRTLARARWGLTPPWLTDLSKTPAHARAETVAEQPMFREALRLRRCLLPANGFYEWRGNLRKRPYWLTPGEGSSCRTPNSTTGGSPGRLSRCCGIRHDCSRLARQQHRRDTVMRPRASHRSS